MDHDHKLRIEELPAFELIGLEQACGMGVDNNIPALWEQLFTRFDEIPGFVDCYGACLPREDGLPGFRYIAGAKVAPGSAAPEGMIHTVVPAAKYAVFGFDDVVEQMPARFQEIYTTLLPAAGLTPDSSYQCLEFYAHDCYDEQTKKIRAELYIAVH